MQIIMYIVRSVLVLSMAVAFWGAVLYGAANQVPLKSGTLLSCKLKNDVRSIECAPYNRTKRS